MAAIVPSTTLADLVIVRPELAPRLDGLGLDYCCGGGRSLAAAVEEADLDLDEVLTDLEAVPVGDATEQAWSDVGELVDWIERTHHVYLRQTLPWLTDLADKVRDVHGANHPELAEVAVLVRRIGADLEPHLAKEEQVLFPMVRELASATSSPAFHCGTLANPIRVMLSEHDDVGSLLARLRTVTGRFQAPDDGCASYRTLYAALADLEADTHRHVHLENNVLFPAVLDAEQTLQRRDDEGGDAPCWAHLFADADERREDRPGR